MSSHHIVRENQEPALLIIGEQIDVFHDLLGQLLEWSPSIIVWEEALPVVFAKGIKADALVLTPQGLEKYTSDIQTQMPVSLLTGQKHEFAQLTLTYLGHLKSNGLHIISPAGFPAEIVEHYSGVINLFRGNYRGVLVQPDTMYEKWLPENSQLEIECSGADTLSIRFPSEGDLWHVLKNGDQVRIETEGFYLFSKALGKYSIVWQAM